MLSPLAVTTSDRRDPALRERARQAALEVGVPFLEREHETPLRAWLERFTALLVFEARGVCLVDASGTLRFSPGLAHLRIRQLDAGVKEDMLLRIGELAAGERVLDCTFGLGADARVAARLVGPSGAVAGLEKSPALYLLARHGLPLLPEHPLAAKVELLHADAAVHLAALPDASYDVVLLDPMFGRPRRSSFAFEAMRHHADASPLTASMLAQARRVARRCVLLKAARYANDFKALGVRPEPARPNATVLWARLPGTGCS